MHISWLKKIAVTVAVAAAFMATITFLSPAASAASTASAANNVAAAAEAQTTILRSWATGRCLESNFGGRVFTAPCQSGNNYQYWTLHQRSPNSIYENYATGMCLAANAPGAIYTTECQNSTNWTMYWDIGRPYANVVVVRHRTTIQCVDSNHAGNAYTHTCGSNFQDWKESF
jgi:serine/threonine-protein kinase